MSGQIFRSSSFGSSFHIASHSNRNVGENIATQFEVLFIFTKYTS